MLCPGMWFFVIFQDTLQTMAKWYRIILWFWVCHICNFIRVAEVFRYILLMLVSFDLIVKSYFDINSFELKLSIPIYFSGFSPSCFAPFSYIVRENQELLSKIKLALWDNEFHNTTLLSCYDCVEITVLRDTGSDFHNFFGLFFVTCGSQLFFLKLKRECALGFTIEKAPGRMTTHKIICIISIFIIYKDKVKVTNSGAILDKVTRLPLVLF